MAGGASTILLFFKKLSEAFSNVTGVGSSCVHDNTNVRHKKISNELKRARISMSLRGYDSNVYDYAN